MDLRQVFDDLVRFETVLWNGLDARLRQEADVTLGSFNVLLIVDATPSCRVYDIANAVAITVGGASQAVDRLEKLGLVERRANPGDRRSSIVVPTSAGREKLASAGAVFDRELAKWLRDPLSRTGLTQFGGTLAKLRAAAKQE